MVESSILNMYQKRQAALLYHFSSMEHLDLIIERMRALAAMTDMSLDLASRLERDRAMRTVGWERGHPNPDHFEYGMPRLNDYLKALSEARRLRAQDWFDVSGVSGTLTGIDQFPIYWSSPEEEHMYRTLSGEARAVANRLDATVLRTWTDYDLAWLWEEYEPQLGRMPRFRLRTDVVGETGKLPPRTGVYVPQDDPCGTPQFAWTGNSDGALRPCETLSDLAREYMALVGRDRLWQAPNSLMEMPDWVRYTDQYFDSWCRSVKNMSFPDSIASRNERACATRFCKWVFVERIDGEFEDAEPAGDGFATPDRPRILFRISNDEDATEAPEGSLWPGFVILLVLLGLICIGLATALIR